MSHSNALNSLYYQSVHHSRFGLNAQAVRDINLRLIYLSVAVLGKTIDVIAYYKLTGICSWME